MSKLVLERKMGESIIINGNIKITYVPCNRYGSKIKLAIDAPTDVQVDREEIYMRKLKDNTIRKTSNASL